MTLSNFLSAAWNDHATDSEGVAKRLPQGLALIETAEDIPPFVNLAVHVLGEHLGSWDDGLTLLDNVAAIKFCAKETEASRAVLRSKAILFLCKGETKKAEELGAAAHSAPWPAASTLVRINASAAAALVGQKRFSEAASLMEKALGLAAYGPKRDDPAPRALAVTGNNLACELEKRATRDPIEVALMKNAATVARQYWEVAGTWLEVERAEYRLAMTMIAAGDAAAALEHAELCLKICKSNNADLFEYFFAHEARTKCFLASQQHSQAENARNDAKKVVESMKQSVEYLEGQLKALNGLLG
jgi:hypothetical protein